MRGSDGKLCFGEKKRGKVWQDCMDCMIMNDDNDWVGRRCCRRSSSLCK